MKQNKKGFTLIELLVVISIIAVLMSILMPALGKVKEQAMKVVCGSNTRQQAIAFTTYASDNAGKYPHRLHPGHWPHGSLSWYHTTYSGISGASSSSFNDPAFIAGHAALLKDGYIESPEFMFCPAAKKGQQSYDTFLEQQTAFAKSGNVEDILWFAVIIGYDYWCGYQVHSEDVSLHPGYFPGGKINQVLKKAVAKDSTSRGDLAIASDMIATESDYETPFLNDYDLNNPVTYFNHISRGEASGGNVVYNDGSVLWQSLKKMKEEKDSNGDYKRIRLDMGSAVGQTIFWF